jgi:hypothetical protein
LSQPGLTVPASALASPRTLGLTKHAIVASQTYDMHRTKYLELGQGCGFTQPSPLWSLSAKRETRCASCQSGAANLRSTARSRSTLLFAPGRPIKAFASGASSRSGRRVMPNPSVEWTRYGRQRKPGLRHTVHHLRPGLRCLPPRAPHLER